ncbi:MAG TPA: hypothetical protein VGF21_12500 [Thermoleophilaceae bacterium]
MRRPDLPSLIGGLALVGFGTVLLLDRTGAIDLRFGTFAPIALAAMGAILVSLGLGRRA